MDGWMVWRGLGEGRRGSLLIRGKIQYGLLQPVMSSFNPSGFNPFNPG